MLIRPHTLSIITTHQCTAACDHCCFTCAPSVTHSIPYERMHRLIDEAAAIPSMRVIVFTGGECFLLDKKLDDLIRHATSLGLLTRCVTNGYWAGTPVTAKTRMEKAAAAGLKEINLSTGPNHAKYVPVTRVRDAAIAASDVDIRTLITAEIFNKDDFDVSVFLQDEILGPRIFEGHVGFQRNVWIDNCGKMNLTHKPEHSRFLEANKTGCSTVTNVLAVTPTQSLVACCGLHLERIPDLHLGSVADHTLKEVIEKSEDDLLKIAIHVEGPERLLEFVREHDPTFELPTSSAHPCETCLFLYRSPKALDILARNREELERRVIPLWLASLTVKKASQRMTYQVGMMTETVRIN